MTQVLLSTTDKYAKRGNNKKKRHYISTSKERNSKSGAHTNCMVSTRFRITYLILSEHHGQYSMSISNR